MFGSLPVVMVGLKVGVLGKHLGNLLQISALRIPHLMPINLSYRFQNHRILWVWLHIFVMYWMFNYFYLIYSSTYYTPASLLTILLLCSGWALCQTDTCLRLISDYLLYIDCILYACFDIILHTSTFQHGYYVRRLRNPVNTRRGYFR